MRAKVGDAWDGTAKDDRIFANEVGQPVFPTSLTQWMGEFIKRTSHPFPPAYLRQPLFAEGAPLVVISSNLAMQ